VILLGRKTLETFPQGQPLKERVNIVMTQKAGGEIKGANLVHSVEEVLKAVEKYSAEDVFVVGGASIYKQFLPYCDTAYVTKTDYSYQADAWFPNLDALPDWELIEESEEQTYYDLTYCFQKYVRKNT
jgi:dihydrofolate reductase